MIHVVGPFLNNHMIVNTNLSINFAKLTKILNAEVCKNYFFDRSLLMSQFFKLVYIKKKLNARK